MSITQHLLGRPGAVTLLLFLPSLLAAKIYKGAEYRTIETYTYGRFEVRMKSVQREGMLSSFFTYHEITSTDDWNEIDIEILGRYEDDIQFNPITRGQTNHVSHYSGSFNPALDFHTYAFEWTPTYVAWFVDGKEAHRLTGPDIEGLNLPQKIMMNVWIPQYPTWAGQWNDKVLPAFAYYDWVQYSSFTPDSGTSGTDNNFTVQWKDDFDTWDQSRWQKASHTWGGNACDFVPDNAVIQDGMLILCLTKESSLGYSDNVGPSVLSGRAEENGIRLHFSDLVDSATAVTPANYVVSGKTISSVSLLPDLQQVTVHVSDGDAVSASSIIVKGIKDRFVTPNTGSPQNVTLINATPLEFPIKINCGGSSYKDYLPDHEWNDSVEYGYMDGTLYTNTAIVSGSSDPGVYNTELNGSAKYKVRVPNGYYDVTLMMADNYFSADSQRVFGIAIEDSTVLHDLDLYSTVGKSVAFEKTVSGIQVSDGILDIHFMAGINTPILNGLKISQLATGVGLNGSDEKMHPKWTIGQNYPNPCNGRTVIPLELRQPNHLIVRFYNILGKIVSQIDVGMLDAGRHSISWNAEDDRGNKLPSGIYFYTVEGSIVSATKKLLLIQ